VAKISALLAGTMLTGTERFPMIQAGETVAPSLTQFRYWLVPLLPEWMKGDPGAAGNVAADLLQIKAAAIENSTMIFNGGLFDWQTSRAPYATDELSVRINTVESDHAPASEGAWVRRGPGILSLPDFVDAQQAADYAQLVRGDIYLPAGDFVGDVDTSSDAIFEGPGRLTDMAGIQRSTYAEPRSRFIVGEEYLWAFHNGVITSPSGTAFDILFQGDSTTRGAFGLGILPTEFQLASLCDSHLKRRGLWGPVCHNRATSGMTMREWIQPSGTLPPPAIHLDDDLAAFPNATLCVMRWLLNDGSFGPGYHDIEQSRADLWDALTRMRAAKGVDELSILLMTPNATSETGYRDEAWAEQIARILKRAAREFKCCFIDTYALWRDARAGVGKWLDNQGAGASGIHTDKVNNHWISNVIAKVVFDPLVVPGVSTNTFHNVSGVGFRLVSAAAAPQGFDRGLSIFRTDDPNTFPLDGIVMVTRSADGIVRQENIGYTNETTQRTYTRYAEGDGDWSIWRGLHYEVALADGWSLFDGGTPDALLSKSVDGTVLFSARVKDVDAEPGALICTLLPGFLPLVPMQFFFCNRANNDVGRIQIEPTGAVRLMSGSPADVEINITYRAWG
jgi:hypothetical protein